jgi:hypothetical protein
VCGRREKINSNEWKKSASLFAPLLCRAYPKAAGCEKDPRYEKKTGLPFHSSVKF